ncbi:GntR family transcriptional regulator [Variovorax sp. LT2P21]|uniref:GntR family transcriptional regulator n=1 Tax=Variovorax sp. LT2P21 TaxID=3443731 RepID=UPI003F44E844
MAISTPSDATFFESVESTDLVGLVEAELTRAIVEGHLPPGSRIVEADIARRMGISRAPVREAARRLERQGVLVSRPRHGFAVRTISVQEIDDLYEVRLSIELTSIELACRKADDAGLARVKALVDTMVREAATQAQDERITSDLELHTLICELSGNAHLRRIYQNTQTELRMIIALIDAVYHDPATVASLHYPIVDALMKRDAEAAKAAMRVHLEDAWQNVRALFVKQHGAAPSPA